MVYLYWCNYLCDHSKMFFFIHRSQRIMHRRNQEILETQMMTILTIFWKVYVESRVIYLSCLFFLKWCNYLFVIGQNASALISFTADHTSPKGKYFQNSDNYRCSGDFLKGTWWFRVFYFWLALADVIHCAIGQNTSFF